MQLPDYIVIKCQYTTFDGKTYEGILIDTFINSDNNIQCVIITKTGAIVQMPIYSVIVDNVTQIFDYGSSKI